jgi:hypothetical protein
VKPATEAGRMSARANELRVSPIGQKMVQQSNSYRLSQFVQLRPFFASSKRSCQHQTEVFDLPVCRTISTAPPPAALSSSRAGMWRDRFRRKRESGA